MIMIIMIIIIVMIIVIITIMRTIKIRLITIRRNFVDQVSEIKNLDEKYVKKCEYLYVAFINLKKHIISLII